MKLSDPAKCLHFNRKFQDKSWIRADGKFYRLWVCPDCLTEGERELEPEDLRSLSYKELLALKNCLPAPESPGPQESKEERLREARGVLARDCPPAGSRWKHRKKGGEYVVAFGAVVEATLAPAVVYYKAGTYPAGEEVWVRPLSEFLDGRFVRVGGEQRPDPAPTSTAKAAEDGKDSPATATTPPPASGESPVRRRCEPVPTGQEVDPDVSKVSFTGIEVEPSDYDLRKVGGSEEGRWRTGEPKALKTMAPFIVKEVFDPVTQCRVHEEVIAQTNVVTVNVGVEGDPTKQYRYVKEEYLHDAVRLLRTCADEDALRDFVARLPKEVLPPE